MIGKPREGKGPRKRVHLPSGSGFPLPTLSAVTNTSGLGNPIICSSNGKRSKPVSHQHQSDDTVNEPPPSWLLFFPENCFFLPARCRDPLPKHRSWARRCRCRWEGEGLGKLLGWNWGNGPTGWKMPMEIIIYKRNIPSPMAQRVRRSQRSRWPICSLLIRDVISMLLRLIVGIPGTLLRDMRMGDWMKHPSLTILNPGE